MTATAPIVIELSPTFIFPLASTNHEGELVYHRRVDDPLLRQFHEQGIQKLNCVAYGENLLGLPVACEKNGLRIKCLASQMFLAPPKTRNKGYNLERMEMYVDYVETPQEAERAWLIGADGFISEACPDQGEQFSLKALQCFVGGDIEITRPKTTEGRLLVVNENFIAEGLSFNRTASGIHGHVIQGAALLCPCEMIA